MKTRRIERHRLVPHTVDGETEMVLDTEVIDVPLPPRDWDQTVRTAVTVGAALLVTACVVWSTASIGDLLARVTVTAAAYGAAAVFDLTWIICMGVEWLFRYDPDRAALPRRAGHFALAIAMAAVGAHGYLAGVWAIGAVGAAVSGLAKGAWTVVMRVHARPLDDRTQQWVAKRRAMLDGQLAMIPIRREHQRGQNLIDAERRALAAEAGTATPDLPEADPGNPEKGPEGPEAALPEIGPTSLNTQDAVRDAWDSGIRDPEAVLRCVRKATGRDVPMSTVDRYLRALRVGA